MTFINNQLAFICDIRYLLLCDTIGKKWESPLTKKIIIYYIKQCHIFFWDNSKYKFIFSLRSFLLVCLSATLKNLKKSLERERCLFLLFLLLTHRLKKLKINFLWIVQHTIVNTKYSHIHVLFSIECPNAFIGGNI